MTAVTDFDLLVLGAGATGLGAARSGRRAGRRVALVEAARPGGDCTHFGCVPSKALLETARRVQAARSGPSYGFAAPVSVDFPAVMQRVADVIADIEQDESPELLARQGIDLISGYGTFLDEHTIDVSGRRITADRFVLACGSHATIPPIEGLSSVGYLDNTTVFALREQPTHLLVLGGGPIGVELAQAFRRLGSEVTILQGPRSLVPREEPEAASALTAVLTREGVTVRTGQTVVRVTEGPTLHLADGSSVSGSHLLVATGRTPSTKGIGLENLGVTLDDRGRVVTDDYLQAGPTAWAAGDCTSKLLFTHVGDEQGRLAAGNAFASRLRPGLAGGRRKWDDRVVPWVTFTEPEIAHVGLTEAEAVAEHGDAVRVSTVSDTHSDRARTAGETDGLVKMIAIPGRVGGMALGKLVGMTVVGPMAGEQIAQGALSMRAGLILGRIPQTISAYPTWSLTTRIAASRFFGSYGGDAARPGRATPPPPYA
jgi:pyruvate/2-oxoglutarate dehydrogenase complex dihydrolipoamide dehydrogenase (E3) component